MEFLKRISRHIRPYLPAILLILILLVAGAFRFYGLGWDSQMDANPHPDERHLANTMGRVSLPWPPNLRNLIDPAVSTLNPRRVNPEDAGGGHYDLAYGTLPVYLYRFLASIIPGQRGSYAQFFMLGRVVTVLLSLLTILLVYMIGKMLFGRRAGLLAAAFLALAVTHIQLSHFMTVDAVLTTFAAATIYCAVRLLRRRRWYNALLMGLMVGFAMACKVSGLTLGAVLVAAGILTMFVADERGRRSHPVHALRYLALAGFGVVLGFGLFEFYVFLDPATYLKAIGSQADMVTGEDWPFTRQYVNTPAYLYHLDNLARWGLGWPLTVAAVAGALGGLVYGLYVLVFRPSPPAPLPILGEGGRPGQPASFLDGLSRALSGRPAAWGLLLLLAWGLPYFAQIGRYTVKFVRYMLPLAPVLCLLAAWLVALLAGWARRRVLAGVESASSDADGASTEVASEDATSASVATVATSTKASDSWLRRHLERLGSGRAPSRRVVAGVAYALVLAVVLVPTAIWAFAFSRIYSRPHTWVQASRWLYANAPEGSVFSEEIWDDSLPVNLSQEGLDRGRHNFSNVAMNVYHDMPPEEKLQHIAGVLNQVDYVILATPRLYGAVRRLPWRYPVEIRYYELLFEEKLGFELAYSATSYPSVWGKAFPDDAADESFSVYDHPKVLIYRKTRALSEADFRALFADVLGAVPLVRRDIDEPPVVLPVPAYQQSLLLDRPVSQLPAVDDWAWNALANAGTLPAVLFWLLALLLVGAAAFPLAAVLFPTFPERGFLLALPLGLMIVAYLTWLPASLGLWHYTVWAVAAALVMLALLSFGAARWRRLDLRAIWRSARKAILIGAAVFMAGFVVFLLIRIANPDMWHPVRGGEKPMEVGFLNAILRSPTMPPLDPFFSDGYINYYYYGLFVVSTLVKLTGIRSSIAFNLIIPTLAAMTIGGACSVVWALTGRRLWGIASGAFVTLIGNVAGAGQIRGRGGLGEAITAMKGLADPAQRDTLAGTFQGLFRWIGGMRLPLRTDWFWDASRAHGAYENTITEFPLFSFLFADLHPHAIGIPFAILLVALSLSLVRSAKQKAAEAAPLLLLLPALALGLGTMAVNNSWDFPVYLLAAGGAFVLAHRVRQPAGSRRAGWGWALLAGILGAGLLGALGLLLYAPFFTYFKAFVRGIGITTYPTEVNYYLGMFGFFIYPLASLILGLALLAGYRAWALRRGLRQGLRQAQPTAAEAVGMPSDMISGWSVTLEEEFYLEEGDELEAEGSAQAEAGVEVEAQAEAEAEVQVESEEERAPATVSRPRFDWRAWVPNVPLLLALLIPLVSILVMPALYGGLNLSQMLTFILLGELVLGAALMLVRDDLSDDLRFVALVALVGLLVSLGVEIVYVKDHLSGTWYRMNTIFKFYIQVWVLFGMAAAGALWAIASRLQRRRPALEVLWWTGFAALLAAVLVYPIFGTYTRVNDRFPIPPARGTLDGQAYMESGDYDYEGRQIFMDADYRAIRWLEENLRGTPIVLQAAWEFYRANGVRIAWNTGYPTVLNPLHEDEQRYPDQKGRREQDVYRLYNEPDADLALRLLSQYGVDYVYVGPFERAAYQPAGVEKFANMADSLDRVYDDGEVQIYQVKDEARVAGGGGISAPLAVPTVPPRQATERTEADLKRLRQAAEANPADAGLQFDLGNRLRQAGQYDEAVKVFLGSLKYHPEDVAMYQTLGDTYQDMGKLDEALAQYQAATAAAPKNAAAFNKLGVAFAERERWDEAIQAFQTAVGLDPAFAEAYYHWGDTLERAGRVDEAVDVYEQLLGTAPNNDWAKKAQERLGELATE